MRIVFLLILSVLSLSARFDERCEASVTDLLLFTCHVILWLLEMTNYILALIYMHSNMDRKALWFLCF